MHILVEKPFIVKTLYHTGFGRQLQPSGKKIPVYRMRTFFPERGNINHSKIC